MQKQPPRGVLKKRCSENMQQIYRRTPILKCDFNKAALLGDRSNLDQNDLKVMETLYFMVTAHQTIQTVSGKKTRKKTPQWSVRVRVRVRFRVTGFFSGEGFFPRTDSYNTLITNATMEFLIATKRFDVSLAFGRMWLCLLLTF